MVAVSKKRAVVKKDKVEILKQNICDNFYNYYKKSGLSQKELASKLGIDDALMSRILNGKYERCTVDRLLHLMEMIHPKYKVQVETK